MTGLSVVIACRDRDLLLRDCLASLILEADDEVIVVDAASRTGAVQDVAHAAGATVIHSPIGSASGARNLGWRLARHDAVAFIDDDCRPAADWALSVKQALADLDAVCGRVVAAGHGHLSVLDDHRPRDYRAAESPALLGHGANLAVRRPALLAVGGWDERLGPGTPWPGAEDKDLLLRLLAAGFTAGYRPEPVVQHLQWRSLGAALRAEHGYGRGVAGLARKGRGPVLADWVRASARTTLVDARAGYRYGVVAGVVRTAGIVRGGLAGRP